MYTLSGVGQRFKWNAMEAQALSAFPEFLITRTMTLALRLKSKQNASTEGIPMAENRQDSNRFQYC